MASKVMDAEKKEKEGQGWVVSGFNMVRDRVTVLFRELSKAAHRRRQGDNQ